MAKNGDNNAEPPEVPDLAFEDLKAPAMANEDKGELLQLYDNIANKVKGKLHSS